MKNRVSFDGALSNDGVRMKSGKDEPMTAPGWSADAAARRTSRRSIAAGRRSTVLSPPSPFSPPTKRRCTRRRAADDFTVGRPGRRAKSSPPRRSIGQDAVCLGVWPVGRRGETNSLFTHAPLFIASCGDSPRIFYSFLFTTFEYIQRHVDKTNITTNIQSLLSDARFR